MSYCSMPPGHCERLPLGNPEGQRAELTEEERDAPAICFICNRVICDDCAYGLSNVPGRIIMEYTGRNDLDPDKRYDYCMIACPDDFDEDWV